MGSQSKTARLHQKDVIEQELAACVARLAAEGKTGKEAKRDPVLRKLQAEQRKVRKQLATIETQAAIAASLVEHKAERAAQPTLSANEKRKQRKAAGAATAADGAGKKKKKKEAEPAE